MVRYKIMKAPIDNAKFNLLYENLTGLVSRYMYGGYFIIARYGVNKTTLKKILQKYLGG
ncbi:hypothetical protein LCGC14_1807510 [marine sediment metagenome]|uniref:Uncharacterized protein n=1 Tax=marine sediment metagenome TaxID=412755 RepID=A0A0F9GML2_9ZZZZ